MTQITHGMGKGIASGTLASTATLLLGFVVAGADQSLGWQALALLLQIGGFALPFACTLIALAATVLGLPIVWLLEKMHCANALSIGLAGAALGAGVFLVPSLDDPGSMDPDLPAFILAATAGGGVTGWVWGATQQGLRRALANVAHPNRIDDQRMLR